MIFNQMKLDDPTTIFDKNIEEIEILLYEFKDLEEILLYECKDIEEILLYEFKVIKEILLYELLN